MNTSLFALWLPTLVGASLAFVASALVHMLLKYHNSDYQRLADEDAVMDAVRECSPSPGLHSFPYATSMEELNDEAIQARYKRGPVGLLVVMQSGLPAMGRLLAQQFAFFLVGSLLIGYCASLALAPGAAYFEVFRFVMSVGFLTFGWGTVPFSIWYGFQWSITAKYLLDALIYSAVIAGTFAGFWPTAG